MDLKEIKNLMNLNFSNDIQKHNLIVYLTKIKPLSGYDVDNPPPLEKIEKLVSLLVKKYDIEPQWMVQSYFLDNYDVVYSMGIIQSHNRDWLFTISGSSLYEIYSKLALALFLLKRNNIVGLRMKDISQAQREAANKKG